MAAEIHIGTQGWNYDAWVGPFYPSGTRPSEFLTVYARAFDSVEVDSTFYASPAAATIRSWADRTPKGFIFSLKLPQEVTHEQRLRDVTGASDVFFERVRELGGKLGPILVQTRPDFQPGELPAPGRSRVLSAIGRDGASERWYTSEHGPRSPIAHAAPAQCASCGFFLPLSGELGRFFGACANAYAPDDGRVVSADHGCGAHSEAMADAVAARTATPVIDEFGYDLVELPGISVGETVFEPLSRGAD